MKFGEEPPHIKLCFYNTTIPEQREVFFEKFIEWLCQYDERLVVEFISDDPERIRHPFSYDKLKTNRQEVFENYLNLIVFISEDEKNLNIVVISQLEILAQHILCRVVV